MVRALLIAALVLGSAAPGAAVTPQTNAKLAVVGFEPFAVRGVAFKPGEAVVVQLTQSGEMRSRRTTATANGTFRMRFLVSVGRCERFSVRAFGARGSRAIVHSGFQLDCEPDR